MYVPLQPNWETEKSDSINTFCTKNNKNYSEKNKQEKKRATNISFPLQEQQYQAVQISLNKSKKTQT